MKIFEAKNSEKLEKIEKNGKIRKKQKSEKTRITAVFLQNFEHFLTFHVLHDQVEQAFVSIDVQLLHFHDVRVIQHHNVQEFLLYLSQKLKNPGLERSY